MLDLKKLEKKLDEALAAETAESLTVWLTHKRLNSLIESLGSGSLSELSCYQKVDVYLESDPYKWKVDFEQISYKTSIKLLNAA